MADNSKMVVTMARCLAIGHIVTGSLLFCLGLVYGIIYQHDQFTVGFIFFGVWISLRTCITVCLGIPGSRRENTRSRSVFTAVFMGFSIFSAVMGGFIIISDSQEINFVSDYDGWSVGLMAISVIILILGIAEFVIGIWAAICCCIIKPCTCCIQEQPHQLFLNDPAGYMTQGPDGGPVAIPAQASRHVMTQGTYGVPVAIPAQASRQVMTQGPGGALPVLLPEQASGGGVPVSVATDAPSDKLGRSTPLNEQI